MNDTTAVTNKASPDAVARKERAQRSEVALIPPVDVIEDSTGITLRADLPGVPIAAMRLRKRGSSMCTTCLMA
jgi:HSP20 family protein